MKVKSVRRFREVKHKAAMRELLDKIQSMLQNKGDMLGLAEEQQDIIDLLNKQLSKVAPVPNITVSRC